MRFGILYWTPYTSEHPADRQFEEAVGVARATRDAGFDLFAANHGYLDQSPLRMLQPIPMLARLAPETGDMQLATAIFLLALHQPVDIAEQTATLDVISGGRFVFGVGVGGRNIPCDQFGIDPAHRGVRTGESLQIIRRLWTEDEVTYEGQHFSITGARCDTKPVQRPHPPIWVGATEDRAIRRAARLGDAWYVAPYGPLAEVERGLGYYRERLDEFGKQAPAELPIRRDIYVGADQDMAMRDGMRYLTGEMTLWTGKDYDPDLFLIGSPDAIVEQIERYRERLGDLYWVFRIHWPNIPYETVLKQIELLGSRVLPHFR